LADNSDNVQAATGFLRKLFENPSAEPLAVMALRTRQDEALLPLFAVLSRSRDKEMRLLATASLADVGGPKAAPILLERLRQDPVMTVRAEAIAQLIVLEGIGVGELQEAIQMSDEMVQCLAARALAEAEPDQALSVLERLAKSREPMVARPAQTALLKLGRNDHLGDLRKLFADAETANDLLALLLLQIREEQINEAADLVRLVAASSRPRVVRLAAYRTLAVVAPEATNDLLEAVSGGNRIVLRVQLLGLLAQRPDGPVALEELIDEPDPIGALVRLELARLSTENEAKAAAMAVVKLGHPVVIEYVLGLARKDFEKRGPWAGCYAPALWRIVDAAPAGARRPGQRHLHAAQAVTILADMQPDGAFDRLRAMLGQPYSAKLRAVAAGLMKSANPATCDLMAPLLENPYTELSVDAALALGEHNDRRADPTLRKLVTESQRYSALTSALASWYLLNSSGQAAAVCRQLAQELE